MTTKDRATKKRELTIEDELTDFAADIVSDLEYEGIVRELFNRPAGQWHLLADLGKKADRLMDRIASLQESAGDIVVAWMDYPESSYGAGYCTVSFFVEAIHWHTLAIYNCGHMGQDIQG